MPLGHGELRNSKSCNVGKITAGSSDREMEFCGKLKMIKNEEGVLNINRRLALESESPRINEKTASNRKLALESASPLINEKTASRRKKSGTSYKNKSFGSPNEIFVSKSEIRSERLSPGKENICIETVGGPTHTASFDLHVKIFPVNPQLGCQHRDSALLRGRELE